MKITMRFTSSLLIFWPLLFQGCGSCSSLFSKSQKNQITVEKKAALFATSPELLASLSSFGTYSYSSRLTITLNNNDRKIINNELVSILATPARIYMTKKIDGSHFLEIMNDNPSNTFYVKSRTGDWRSGDSNRAYYRALIGDALNVLVWLNEECMLEKLFVKQGRFFEIINQPLPQNAGLIKLLENPPTESVINGRIEVNKENIPIAANFNISISNGPEFQLKLELELNLTQNKNLKIPDLPVLAHDEALLYPVNIATRFKNLLDPAVLP